MLTQPYRHHGQTQECGQTNGDNDDDDGDDDEVYDDDTAISPLWLDPNT